MGRRTKNFLVHFSLITVLISTSCQTDPATVYVSSSHHEYIYNELRLFKDKYNVKSLSFALFNSNESIEEICLGKSTFGTPVDRHTLFGIQSISKNITALAIMMAVQDSTLDLKTPISMYLPDFTINSCFESYPQDKITLEMLLSHTAGFTHEAPAGNNYDYCKVSFQEHLNSIPDTWLKFPAGTKYSYSNLGYDLAAQIIEVACEKSFDDYLSEKVFIPLEMYSTTVNDDKVVSNINRTEGVIPFLKTSHNAIPMVGAGGVYTNLEDLTKYTQFHMNLGRAGEEQVLDQQYLYEMYRIRSRNCGLGTYMSKSQDNYFINHNGGGYGFTSTLFLMPEHNLGVVLLCNEDALTFEFCEFIMNSYIEKTGSKRNAAITELFDSLNNDYFEEPEAFNRSEYYSCNGETVFQEKWEVYTGTYAIMYPGYNPKWYTKLAFNLGYRPQKIEILNSNNKLVFKGDLGESSLREIRKGIFISEDGEIMDFSKEIPTYRNIKLEKR